MTPENNKRIDKFTQGISGNKSIETTPVSKTPVSNNNFKRLFLFRKNPSKICKLNIFICILGIHDTNEDANYNAKDAKRIPKKLRRNYS